MRNCLFALIALALSAVAASAQSLPFPDRTNCASAPRFCGYPNAYNTGPVAGTVFRRVPEDITSGPGWWYDAGPGIIRVDQPNAILENVEAHTIVVVDGPNATVRNNKIFSCNNWFIVAVRAGRPQDGYLADNAKIHNNLIGCDGPLDQRSDRGISDAFGLAKNMRVWRNNVFNTSNGITVDHEGVVRGNYVHDLGHKEGDHSSGISTHGGATRVVIDFNTVIIKNASGAITVYSDFAHAQNVTVTRNLLSGGGYSFYGGESGGMPPANGNIHFKWNRVSRVSEANGGVWGPWCCYKPGEKGNVMTGNVWDEDLTPLPGN